MIIYVEDNDVLELSRNEDITFCDIKFCSAPRYVCQMSIVHPLRIEPPVASSSSTVGGKYNTLKGQCHEIFCFWFFMNQFPPAPEYPIRIVSNFKENSRRYSQVKVYHQYQQHRWQICHQFR